MKRTVPIPLTPDQTARILILKPSSLGDIVHALPVLSALRRACPLAHITWTIRPELAGLLECVSGVDKIQLFDRRTMGRWFTPAGCAALWAFLRDLRGGRYDLVLDLQGLLRTALFARVSGCPLRVGPAEAREGASLFYTHTAPPARSPHIIDAYLELLRFLEVPVSAVEFGIQPPEPARRAMKDLLRQKQIHPNQLAVLIPGSAHARKCWPPERFAHLAEYLHRQANLRVIAVGSQKEHLVVDQMIRCADVPVLNLTGQTTLPQLAALLEQAALVVGNDTGPAHLAAAMDVPTVVIFGPTNPARLGPYRKPDSIAAIEPFGRGRGIDHSNPKYKIENVSPEMVIEKAGLLLSASR